MLKQSLPRSKVQKPSESRLAQKGPTMHNVPKRYLRPDVNLLLKSKAEIKKSELKYIDQKYVRKYYGNKVLYVNVEMQENRIKHYLKDLQNLRIIANRSYWDEDWYYAEYDDDSDKDILGASYRIEFQDTTYIGRRVILGHDIKIETKWKLKLLQKMIFYSHNQLKVKQIQTIRLLRYATNVEKLKIHLKNPNPKSFSKISLRPDAFKHLKSLDFKFTFDCAGKRGAWHSHAKVSLQPFLETLSKSKLLISASFRFKFLRFSNKDLLKNIGLWLDNNRQRNFYVNVELEATDYSISAVPLIEFKPILKHCDLLRLFIRNDRGLNTYEEYDDHNPLQKVPYLGSRDPAGTFEKKRRIVLSVFKDDCTPNRKEREDFRALLGCCENLKSLVFSTCVSLFTWGANQEYKTEGGPQNLLKKDYEKNEEEEEDSEDSNEESEEEEKIIDEETIRLRKLEAEDKAKRCLQGLEEIVIACTTMMGEDSQEDNIYFKLFEFIKQRNWIPSNAEFPEDFLPKKLSESRSLSEFLKYFLAKINENSCSLRCLSLCHCFFDEELASKDKTTGARDDEEDCIITNMLTDKNWKFESVETIQVFPGKNDDYDKLKSMLAQMKNLKKLIINLRPFYRKQDITIGEVEKHIKDIRKALPNLQITIIDDLDFII